MLDALSTLRAAARYLRENPREIVKTARDATSLRFGVPIVALRWAASKAATGKRAPKDVAIDAVPPAMRLAATIDAMGTPIRAKATLRIDEVRVSEAEMRVAVRIREIQLDLPSDVQSPLSALIRSGALDLSRPGDLVKFLPKKPPALVEAEGDRIVLDLLKLPALGENPRVRRALALISPVLGIRAIETDGERLYVALRATPARLPEVIATARRR
jgi:hypothetical protein